MKHAQLRMLWQLSLLVIGCCGLTPACGTKEEKTPSAQNGNPAQETLEVKDRTAAEPDAGGGVRSTEAATDSGDAGVPTVALRDAGPEPAACVACRNAHCRDYQGVNLVSGCLEALNTQYGARAGDPNFVAECTNIMTCARVSACGLSEPKRAAGCYCGSASVDECASKGPAHDAPCAAEWQAGARAKSNKEMHERFTDLVYPAGWAYALLDCEREFCASECSSSAPARAKGTKRK